MDFVNVVPIPDLPPCIPNLSARRKIAAADRYPVMAAKATDIGGILSANPTKVVAWRATYGIPSTSIVLVHQESRDHLQDRLGQQMDSPDFYDHVKMVAPNLIVVAPGYSVYDDGSMCPVRQVLNMRRSLHAAARFNRAGIASIPVLGWNKERPQDLEFLAAWLSEQREHVQALAVNAQTGTSSLTLTLLLAQGMLELERLAKWSGFWVVFGGRKRVAAISEFIPRSRIVQVARPKDFHEPSGDNEPRSHRSVRPVSSQRSHHLTGDLQDTRSLWGQ